MRCKTKCRVVKPAATITSVDSSDDGAESDDASTVLTATSVSSDKTLVEVRVKDRGKEVRCKCREKKKSKGECGCKDKKSKNFKLVGKDEPARSGIGHLVTGQPCSLHIIDGSQIALSALTDRTKSRTASKFTFRIFKV